MNSGLLVRLLRRSGRASTSLLTFLLGEYVEVVDYDPSSGVFYQPVDLNHPHLLAQDGPAPSESDPQFHQRILRS